MDNIIEDVVYDENETEVKEEIFGYEIIEEEFLPEVPPEQLQEAIDSL
jgi:hypothetical protein